MGLLWENLVFWGLWLPYPAMGSSRNTERLHLARIAITVNPVLSGHLKINKTKVLKTDGSLMQVGSIAECSLGAFCNIFDLHNAIIGLENQILVFYWVAA